MVSVVAKPLVTKLLKERLSSEQADAISVKRGVREYAFYNDPSEAPGVTGWGAVWRSGWVKRWPLGRSSWAGQAARW